VLQSDFCAEMFNLLNYPNNSVLNGLLGACKENSAVNCDVCSRQRRVPKFFGVVWW